jgi:hypothetical protein
MAFRRVTGNLELGVQTLLIVAVLVGIRAVLWALGVEGMAPTAVSSGIIAGGIFVMGLVVAGTLSDSGTRSVRPPTSPPGCTRSSGKARRCTPCGARPTSRSCAAA